MFNHEGGMEGSRVTSAIPDENRNDPDHLYDLLVGALHDGFAPNIVSYAEHFQRTDPDPARGATLLGIVYMENDRLDDAERVFNRFLATQGENGRVLTNLAKVHSRRGDDARAEAMLWRALELDPNQENGVHWYSAIHEEREGMSSSLAALRRELRQLWEAGGARFGWRRDALEQKGLGRRRTVLRRIARDIPPTRTGGCLDADQRRHVKSWLSGGSRSARRASI